MTPQEIDSIVGANVRAFRHMREMSQQQLGDAIGVKFQQIQKYETGFNRISASKLVQIANALDVSLFVLFRKVLPETEEFSDYMAHNPAELKLLTSYRAASEQYQQVALLTLAGS